MLNNKYDVFWSTRILYNNSKLNQIEWNRSNDLFMFICFDNNLKL